MLKSVILARNWLKFRAFHATLKLDNEADLAFEGPFICMNNFKKLQTNRIRVYSGAENFFKSDILLTEIESA